MEKKIIIVGVSGSGKSTLAQKLSYQLHIPHIELDNLYWDKNWSINDKFLEELEISLKAKEWVMCGNYSSVRDLTWMQANILIWLDYSFPTVLWRAFIRSLKRIYNQQPICGENRESLIRLFSKNSIIVWVFQAYFKRKKQYSLLLALKQYAHLKVIKVTQPDQLADKIKSLLD